jgi:hypothetical protein
MGWRRGQEVGASIREFGMCADVNAVKPGFKSQGVWGLFFERVWGTARYSVIPQY